MDRVSDDRDAVELLDEMEAALAELREGLQGGDHQVADPSTRDEPRPGDDAIAAAAAVLKANARVLHLLGEAIDRGTQSRHPSTASRSDTLEVRDGADAAVESPKNEAARTLLAELRRLNAEIADWLGDGEPAADHGVAIAVESELESIREDLEESREE